MSSLRPKRGTQEYAEQCADDPSDFITDEPEESKTAVKSTPAEKRFQAALADKVAKEDAQKEIDACMAMMSPVDKKRMLAAMSVVATPGSAPPRVKYDHATTLKNLAKNTEPALAFMETLKDDYESVFYMGSLCDYWKSLINMDRAQINGHNAFMKYFKTVRHLHGLPATSRNVSRNVSMEPNDISIEEGEDDGDEAGAGSD